MYTFSKLEPSVKFIDAFVSTQGKFKLKMSKSINLTIGWLVNIENKPMNMKHSWKYCEVILLLRFFYFNAGCLKSINGSNPTDYRLVNL